MRLVPRATPAIEVWHLCEWERGDMTKMWTDQMKARVWELAKGNASSSTIAQTINREFGTVFTRNAVIGMCHRIAVQLPLPPKAHQDAQTDKPKRLHVRKRPVVNMFKDNGERRPSFVPMSQTEDQNIPMEQRRSVMQLTADTCRFPVGDVGQPGFFFCGAVPERGRPYCAGHMARTTATRPSR